MKAITPTEAVKQRIVQIPDEMIDVVNELIISNTNPNSQCQSFSITVKMINSKFKEKYPNIELKNEWFDFEEVFRKAGWKVGFDRPAYNERYDAYYHFRYDPSHATY